MRKPYFGKVELYKAVEAQLTLAGVSLPKKVVRSAIDATITCMVNGLFDVGCLTIDKLGAFTIQNREEESREHSSDLAIKSKVSYRQTKFIRELLKHGNTLQP
jgi:nucleoid DNA-binding protein